jgi:hypothetical protein
MNPGFRDEIQRKLARLMIPILRVLDEGLEISF